MLMVTTTVNVINRIHSNTTSTRPRIPLDTILVERPSSLQNRLINPSTPSNNPNHPSRRTRHNLLGTGRQLQPCLALVGIVANDNDIVARGTSEGSTVADLFLDIRDDCAFGHDAEGENVADSQVCLFSGIDELASVHALVSDKGFSAVFVAVGIAEDDFGEGGSTAGIVDDFLDDASEVAVSLGVLHTPR